MEDRKKAILEEAVRRYIDTAEPVGSKLLAEHSSLNVSSATIRNELNELERDGYLVQPHTSSGRVPTDQGYRFYVDQLPVTDRRTSGLTTAQQQLVLARLQSVGGHIQDVLFQVTEILNSLIDYTTIVLTPDIYQETLKFAQLILVDMDRILVVLLNSAGVNSEFLVHFEGKIDQEDLNKISRLISEKLEGKPVTSITEATLEELARDLPRLTELLSALAKGIRALREQHAQSSRLVTKGMGKLLKLPEFRNIELTQRVVATLEENKVLAELLAQHLNTHSCQVMIGHETQMDALQDCSLVVASVSTDESQGVIGVLGPRRMAYSQIVPMVEQISAMVGDYLSKNTFQKEGLL